MKLDLQFLFVEYNQRFFDNDLPDMPVRWIKTPRGVAAEFWTNNGEMGINIHPLFRKWGLLRYVKMLLIHEMAHAKLRNRKIQDHGRVWNNEMLRLANAGAFYGLW